MPQRSRIASLFRLRSPGGESDAPSFSELIAARTAMVANPGDAAAKTAYQKAHDDFAAYYGTVDSVYWGADGRSGVAVTVRRGLLATRARLHRVSDAATREVPEISGAIQDWEILAVRAQMLRGEDSLICMQWIFAGISYLLAAVLADPPGRLSPAETARILAQQRKAMANANTYYVANATRGAHTHYFWGMIVGVFCNMGMAAIAVAFVHSAVPRIWHGVGVANVDQAVAFGAVVAGAIGSILSVLLRMTVGRFAIAYEVGRGRLLLIGSFRPFIGAASGLAVFFALRADFISVKSDDSFYVVAFLAFLAGFSERFARDAFLGVERAVVPLAGAQEPPSGGATVEAAEGDVGEEGPAPEPRRRRALHRRRPRADGDEETP